MTDLILYAYAVNQEWKFRKPASPSANPVNCGLNLSFELFRFCVELRVDPKDPLSVSFGEKTPRLGEDFSREVLVDRRQDRA
jgi:hypothetical protein